MIAWANGMHWAPLVPRPDFFILSVTVCGPAGTGPARPPGPVAPMVTREVPRPAAPMQSSVPATASGVPEDVALPHWVTPMNTVASVAAVVISVTETDWPSVRLVDGVTASVSPLAAAGRVKAATVKQTSAITSPEAARARPGAVRRPHP